MLTLWTWTLSLSLVIPPPVPGAAEQLAVRYEKAIEQINVAHASSPKKNTEEKLRKKVSKKGTRALEQLLELKSSAEVHEALVRCGEASIELDRMEDFRKIRLRLLKLSPEHAKTLGSALSRPRFILRGIGGLDEEYLARFAEVVEAILAGYDELFGFAEWSKVPGKKLRFRIHLEPEITKPPHFAPQFPYHSEVDFPVIDPEHLSSPTKDGKFLFYGLCHELGHVIAMWGNIRLEEDHHAWAHYTGVVLVEHLTKKHGGKPFMRRLRDDRWRSLRSLREKVKEVPPGYADRDAVLSLLVQLHDHVGPAAFGKALNHLEKSCHRINRVRYHNFKALEQAMIRTEKSKKKKRVIQAIFQAARKNPRK